MRKIMVILYFIKILSSCYAVLPYYNCCGKLTVRFFTCMWVYVCVIVVFITPMHCNASVIICYCRLADDQQDISKSLENVSLNSAAQGGVNCSPK